MGFKEELAKKAGQTVKKSGEEKVDSLPTDNEQGADQPVEKEPSAGRFSESSFKGNGYIRPLRAEEIECRVAAINEKGLSLLLYKDARVDQRILDETFGPFGWKRSHQCIDGSLYCTVEIFDRESGEWVSKQDVGTNGYTEKEKSQASDSFKRACFNWGIGRELYSAPFIWIPVASANIQKKENQKEKRFYCNDHFSVHAIGYGSDREIISLTIVNDTQKGKIVYELAPEKKNPNFAATGKAGMPAPNGISGDGITSAQMRSLKAEMERTGVELEKIKERYKIDRLEDMPEETYSRVMKALAKTKSANAA